MDAFENCVEKAGQQLCSLLRRVNQLTKELVDCIEVRDAKSCYDACLEKCRGDDCKVVCVNAVEVALGVLAARDIARRAAAATGLLGLDPIDAIAIVFDAEVKKIEKMECPERADVAMILAAAAVELHKASKVVPGMQERTQDVLLLIAPALALAYRCAGEEAFTQLDLMMPFIGEEAVGRITDALENGVVLVGNTLIKFEPVK